MELENQPDTKRHVSVARVDGIEHIPITGNFLFRTVAWLGLFGNKLHDTLVRRGDTLNAIARLRAQNDRCLPQCFECLGRLLFEHLLFALEFTKQTDCPQQILWNCLSLYKTWCE